MTTLTKGSLPWVLGAAFMCLVMLAVTISLLGRSESPMSIGPRIQIGLVVLSCSAVSLLIAHGCRLAFPRAPTYVRAAITFVGLPLAVFVFVGLLNILVPAMLENMSLSREWNEVEAVRESILEYGVTTFAWGCTAMVAWHLSSLMQPRKWFVWLTAAAALVSVLLFGFAALDMGWGL